MPIPIFNWLHFSFNNFLRIITEMLYGFFTLGEKCLHSIGTVGQISLHGSSREDTWHDLHFPTGSGPVEQAEDLRTLEKQTSYLQVDTSRTWIGQERMKCRKKPEVWGCWDIFGWKNSCTSPDFFTKPLARLQSFFLHPLHDDTIWCSSTGMKWPPWFFIIEVFVWSSTVYVGRALKG